MSDKWTADQIPDQAGRLVVVTGATSGLGRCVATELARAGAQVVLACRDVGRGERVAEALRGARVERLDLADLASVRTFAERLGEQRLDLLVNNAGLMAPPRATTEDGFELQLGTNHLGHFALTGLLLPALRSSPEARVVTVSSGAHRQGKIDFDDLQRERGYRRWSAYGQSKLANLLFAFELERRLRAAGTSVISVAAHPGYAATNLQLSAPPLYERLVMRLTNALVAQSADMGALPLLYAATARGVEGGSYYGPDGFLEGRGHPKRVRPSARALDEDVARRLWGVSEQLTGISYDL